MVNIFSFFLWYSLTSVIGIGIKWKLSNHFEILTSYRFAVPFYLMLPFLVHILCKIKIGSHYKTYSIRFSPCIIRRTIWKLNQKFLYRVALHSTLVELTRRYHDTHTPLYTVQRHAKIRYFHSLFTERVVKQEEKWDTETFHIQCEMIFISFISFILFDHLVLLLVHLFVHRNCILEIMRW